MSVPVAGASSPSPSPPIPATAAGLATVTGRGGDGGGGGGSGGEAPWEVDPGLLRRVFVGLVTPEATEADLHAHFARFGTVASIFLPRPNRGFAFVTYHEEAAAQAALDAPEHVLHGQPLQVKSANPKRPSSSCSSKPSSPSGSEHSVSSVSSAPSSARRLGRRDGCGPPGTLKRAHSTTALARGGSPLPLLRTARSMCQGGDLQSPIALACNSLPVCCGRHIAS
eukprot:SM000199S05434  [mRNA]  locus=s199:206517:207737:- [translate_table: standard]